MLTGIIRHGLGYNMRYMMPQVVFAISNQKTSVCILMPEVKNLELDFFYLLFRS